MTSPSSTASKAEKPLWQQAALRVAEDENTLTTLTDGEHEALFEKAVLVMKPSREEWEHLATDKPRQQAYTLAFVRAYKAGLPPLSGFSDAARYTTPRSA